MRMAVFPDGLRFINGQRGGRVVLSLRAQQDLICINLRRGERFLYWFKHTAAGFAWQSVMRECVNIKLRRDVE
jgi:hypothetical protein